MPSNRKIVKQSIVDSMMDGLDVRRSPWPWYKRLGMKIKWRYEELSYWWRRKREKWQLGYPREESWEFNNHHAKYVTKRLRYFRDNITGVPSEMYPDDYDHTTEWKMEKEDRERAFEKAKRRWCDTLTKIIWAFEHWNDHKDPVYPEDYDHRQRMTEYEDGSVGFESLDDRSADFSPQKEHDKKVDEGLQLFCKYYRNLWD